MAKQKYTVTGTFINQKKPDREFPIAGPPDNMPVNREPIYPMSWGAFPRPRFDIKDVELAEIIATHSPSDSIFYIDTCFLSSPLSQVVWDALMTRRVAITPGIRAELSVRLGSPGYDGVWCKDVRQAFAFGHPAILLPEAEELKDCGYNYYISLLMLRKLKGKQFAEEYKAKHGRYPERGEFHSQFKQQGRDIDDRAFMIAWKGFQDYEKSNYHADEQLVLMAVLNALNNGSETIMLSRDHDLAEQFYKLIHMMDTHFRGMLLAEIFNENPGNHESKLLSEIFEDSRVYSDRFHEASRLINPNLTLPGLWNDLMPADSSWVMIESWWFGGGPTDLSMSRVPFCALQAMIDVAKIKSKTEGLNSDLLGPENCHIWPFPGYEDVVTCQTLPGPDGQSGRCPAAVVGTDVIVTYHDMEFRVLDMIHAVTSREGHCRLIVEES